jgi:hypothetical protein
MVMMSSFYRVMVPPRASAFVLSSYPSFVLSFFRPILLSSSRAVMISPVGAVKDWCVFQDNAVFETKLSRLIRVLGRRRLREIASLARTGNNRVVLAKSSFL